MAVLDMKDQMRYFPAMVRWVGFRQTTLDLQHAERKFGKTTYSYKKLMRLGLDVMLAFSDKPNRLTVKAGLLISLSSVLYALVIIMRYLPGYIKVFGYTSTILSIWLLSGMIFLSWDLSAYISGRYLKMLNEDPYTSLNRL